MLIKSTTVLARMLIECATISFPVLRAPHSDNSSTTTLTNSKMSFLVRLDQPRSMILVRYSSTDLGRHTRSGKAPDETDTSIVFYANHVFGHWRVLEPPDVVA